MSPATSPATTNPGAEVCTINSLYDEPTHPDSNANLNDNSLRGGVRCAIPLSRQRRLQPAAEQPAVVRRNTTQRREFRSGRGEESADDVESDPMVRSGMGGLHLGEGVVLYPESLKASCDDTCLWVTSRNYVAVIR